MMSRKTIIHMQVLETTHHVGRISVSTPSNMPYKEMALHCENLLAGKQQKISTFMGAQSLLANSFRIPLPDYNQEKDESTNSNVQPSLPLVLLYFLYFRNSEQVFLLACFEISYSCFLCHFSCRVEIHSWIQT
jgi:hypothetical protein